ncbi:MAG TPA: hypothetical protein VGM91_02240 [Conexibacter sp.]
MPSARERVLLRRYVDAWERNDVDALVALLREDALLSMPPQRSLAGAAPPHAALVGGFHLGWTVGAALLLAALAIALVTLARRPAAAATPRPASSSR